ncbi:MAG: DUF2505 domain-containing protein [Actinomycetes bacterium]
MSKTGVATMSYQADVSTAYAMLTDPAYSRFKNEKTGGSNVEVSTSDNGDGITIVAKRDLPADVPSYARSLVGKTITTTETDAWGATQPDGSRQATMTIAFSVPAKVTGTFDLVPTETGSKVTITIEAKANVPFIAGKLEGVLVEQFVRAVEAEEPIGQQWLLDH